MRPLPLCRFTSKRGCCRICVIRLMSRTVSGGSVSGEGLRIRKATARRHLSNAIQLADGSVCLRRRVWNAVSLIVS